MDCPAEEQLVRMALDGFPGVESLNFDLDTRTLAVVHIGAPDAITAKLHSLALDATPLDSSESSIMDISDFDATKSQRNLMWAVLAIYRNLLYYALHRRRALQCGSDRMARIHHDPLIGTRGICQHYFMLAVL